jgi:hypothetical protein
VTTGGDRHPGRADLPLAVHARPPADQQANQRRRVTQIVPFCAAVTGHGARIAEADGTTMTPHGPACGHPKLGTVDKTDVTGPANDSYATRHNPFVYFEGIIDNKGYCDAHVVTLPPLRRDLRSSATTPSYSFITPNTCLTATTRRAARTAEWADSARSMSSWPRGCRGSWHRRLTGMA